MTSVRVTHIGGPTTLTEVGGRRLLTDPTLITRFRWLPIGAEVDIAA
jgi:hypothetical protein